MPKAPLKLQVNNNAEKEEVATQPGADVLTQAKRPEPGRFWLQIDRQTKSSYGTFDEAQAAGLVIKAKFPIVQIAVYDKVELTNTVVTVSA